MFEGFIFRLNYTSSYMNGNWIQIKEIKGSAHQQNYGIEILDLEYAYDWYDMRISMKIDGAANTTEMWSAFANHTFETKPRPPDNPPKTDIGGFSINDHGHVYVYWLELHKSRSNGPNLHYDIILLNNPSLKPNTIISTMAKYDNLDGKYVDPLEFNIRSVNDNGTSTAHSSIIIPSHAKRLLPPQNIKKFLHNQMYNLTWLPSKQSDAVTSYTVFWCNSTDEQSGQCTSSIDFKRVDRDVNSFTRPFNGTTMNFAVAANSDTSSSGMIWSKCTALPNSDIGKLEKIWIKELQSTYMVFEWMLSCVDHAILSGFRLTYCPIKDPKLQDCRSKEEIINITGEVNGYNLTNLKPYTTYKTHIQMFSMHSIGPNSDSLVNTTMETAPTPPRNLKYRELTNNSVELMWDEPEQYNGVLAKYEIHYNYGKRIVEANRSKQLLYKLDNLDAYTEYQIIVTGCTNGGNECSKSSNTLKITTKIGIPSEIHQAKAFKINNYYTSYTWSRPNKPAGPIHYYLVKLRLTSGDEFKEIIVPLNGTRCTLTKSYCNGEIDSFKMSVQGVNIVESAHAITENTEFARPKSDLDISQLGYNVNDGSVLKRDTNAAISSTSSNIQNSHISIDSSKASKEFKGTTHDSDDHDKIPFFNDGAVCKEQNNQILEMFAQHDEFAVHLSGNWSASNDSHCDHERVHFFNLLAILLLILLISFIYAVVYTWKRYRKMKDISVELPPGLENLKEDTIDKVIGCNMNNRPEIRDIDFPYKTISEQEQSLLRTRMESSSSSNTENSSHCECNEAMEDSEYEHHGDNGSVEQYENIIDNVSTYFFI